VRVVPAADPTCAAGIRAWRQTSYRAEAEKIGLPLRAWTARRIVN
jgi:hypothetical protein